MTKHVRWSVLVATVGLLLAAAPAEATTGALSGLSPDQLWFVSDAVGTSNGLPAGGSCVDVPNGQGAALTDGVLTGRSGALNNGAMVWVDNIQVGGALTSASTTRAVFAATTIGGLTRQLTYDQITVSPAPVRALLTLTNTTGADMTVPVDYASNHGFGLQALAVEGTSSGDTTFDVNDRWVLVNRAMQFGLTPSHISVLYGPGNPVAPATSVTQTVFDCAGTEGIGAHYSVTVPAGVTRRLMFFEDLTGSDDVALQKAVVYNTVSNTSPLVAGLTPTELREIVNWDVAPPTCLVTAIRSPSESASGKAEMEVTIRDPQSGLLAVTNTKVDNGTLVVAPSNPFPPGTAEGTVTAIKSTAGVPTRFSFDVSDRLNNIVHCA